ncbi:MAG: hypothetical protein KatS3mg118_0377 [Paracoccaceae bacterium]|nr:MAG: hypothetical protein KatS3mg118_0377 [Paracoccaceae bacterium]
MTAPIRLLVTRPLPQGQEFAAALAARWPDRFDPVFWPLLHIEQEPAPLELEGVQALMFTSANGVAAFARASDRRDLPALCVGEGTAEAARRAGLAAESADGDAGALARLAAAAWLPGGGDLLHVRGRDSAGDLAGALRAEGIGVREVILYSARAAGSVPPDIAALLAEGGIDAITLFSPRSARILAAFAAEAAGAGRGWALDRASAIAISPAAAAPLAGLGFARIITAPRPDRAGMLAALDGLAPLRP